MPHDYIMYVGASLKCFTASILQLETNSSNPACSAERVRREMNQSAFCCVFSDIPLHNIYAGGSRQAKLGTCAYTASCFTAKLAAPPPAGLRQGTLAIPQRTSVQLLYNEFNYSSSLVTAAGWLREIVL